MGWNIWIDRGGTFTDVVARAPDGSLTTLKLLSEDKARYDDPIIEAVERLGVQDVDSLRIGTTVATNALLERRGEPTVLVTTRGFGDALWIGYQSRSDLFALNVLREAPIYARVVEVDERVGPDGAILHGLDEPALKASLETLCRDGLKAAAIVFLHAHTQPVHELRAAEIAFEAGFEFVHTSHETSPLIRYVSRGQTTVADAYLTPPILRYFDHLTGLKSGSVFFMQSNGGLSEGRRVRGKDLVYSGPAGGVVGMQLIGRREGLTRLIGIDMGGTSTDVSVIDGDYQLREETVVRELRLRSPSIDVHSVAAGGGSVIGFDGMRLRVGDESAGSDPGPASYGRGGPLTITDCHVLLGRLQPDLFPKVFGRGGREPLNRNAVVHGFEVLRAGVRKAVDGDLTVEDLALSFLDISAQKMAQAVKHLTVSRGLDPGEFALVAFGGAAGQSVCDVAEQLGINTVIVPPAAGLLSALGIGSAEVKETVKGSVAQPLSARTCRDLHDRFERLKTDLTRSLREQELDIGATVFDRFVFVTYENSDDETRVPFVGEEEIRETFEAAHHRKFGFLRPSHDIIIRSLELTATSPAGDQVERLPPPSSGTPIRPGAVWFREGRVETPFVRRADLVHGQVAGPVVVIDPDTTTVVPAGWDIAVTPTGSIRISRDPSVGDRPPWSTAMHPMRLEIFANLFMYIAERMGDQLRRTARSVNVKERLDYSCAIFDAKGRLVANAPHIPVHLGAMGTSVRHVIERTNNTMRPGDAFVSNDPYAGGTHLPDLTVVSPVFVHSSDRPIAFVASRAHHADIGGIAPGSMPAESSTIEEEGVVFDCVRITDGDGFLGDELRIHLTSAPYPARDPDTNIADLLAQLAANQVGIGELRRSIAEYGLDIVAAYMDHLQDNAAAATRRVVRTLSDGTFTVEMDSGQKIVVSIGVHHESGTAGIDFTGTSPQTSNNLNAPISITRSAVLYVLRCLAGGDMPLNAGCLDPIQIEAPRGCFLNPEPPAAVAAGNVETSQCVVDALLGALGVEAGSQGTMNNVAFGDATRQYYETICGGTGAGAHFDGCDAVQCHMTNSRITDPEILEARMPVLVREFSVRRDSGGAGLRRGGHGAVRSIEFLKPTTLSILSNRRVVSAHGLEDGQPGKPGVNRLCRRDGSEEDLASSCTIDVEEGDILSVETPGGGGFGRPVGHRGRRD